MRPSSSWSIPSRMRSATMTKRRLTGHRNRPPWIPFDEWFWSWVDKSGGNNACWPWTRTLNRAGYGQVRYGHKNKVGAHRVAWELSNGTPVPDGLEVLHSCDQPACCNPSHLRPGTKPDNVRDRVSRGRSARGERHGKTVITLDQANEVKRLRTEGRSYREISELTGIKKATVADICGGRTWKD